LDFRAAINRREEDSLNSRTYGIRFLPYFPHRELGIICSKTDRSKEAVLELERSLKFVDSARAKFYLNKVNEDILAETNVDKKNPVIYIESEIDSHFTSKRTVSISGFCEDDYFVEKIFINGEALDIELALKKIFFNKKITLKRGSNRVEIKAQDLTGKVSVKYLEIETDLDGPIVGFKKYNFVEKGMIALSGHLFDVSGVRDFRINDQKVELETENQKDFSFTTNVVGERKIIFSALDGVNNEIRGELDLTDDFFSSLPNLASVSPDFYLKKQTNNILITLKGIEKHNITYDNEFYIDGEIKSILPIKSLFINSEPLSISINKHLFFHHLFECFKETRYNVPVEAIDEAGNIKNYTFTVKKNKSFMSNIKNKMSVLVLPFDKGAFFLPPIG